MVAGFLNPRQVNAVREGEARWNAGDNKSESPVVADTGGKRDLSRLVPESERAKMQAACMSAALVTTPDGGVDKAATKANQDKCRGR